MDGPGYRRRVTRLVLPNVRHQASYLAASGEFAASGELRDGDGDLAQPAEDGYEGFAFTREGLWDPAQDSRNGTRRYWIAL